MREYHFYLIKKDGHIDGPPVEHEAENDKSALGKAKQLVDGHDVEVWQASRLVAYLTPDDK
jgi:hypothetical protein